MAIQLKKLRQSSPYTTLLAASPCKVLADLQEGIEKAVYKSVPYAGRVFGYEEVEAAVDSTLDCEHWTRWRKISANICRKVWS